MDILLLTNNQNLVSLLKCILQPKNIHIVNFTDRDQLKRAIFDKSYLAIVLDLPNPTQDDFIYWRELLKLTSLPVITLSSDEVEIDRVLSRQQATLHLAKPFASLLEKLSFVRNEQHENAQSFNPQAISLAPDIVLDVAGHCIRRKNKCYALSSTEFKILYLLSSNIGGIFPSKEIMNTVDLREDSSLYVYIQKLREKIEEDPRQPRILVNKKGCGYKIQKILSAVLSLNTFLYSFYDSFDDYLMKILDLI